MLDASYDKFSLQLNSDGSLDFHSSTENADGSTGSSFRQGPTLPTANFDHCVVAINQTHLFFAGGVFNPGYGYIYDASSLQLSNPIELPRYVRTEMSCPYPDV